MRAERSARIEDDAIASGAHHEGAGARTSPPGQLRTLRAVDGFPTSVKTVPALAVVGGGDSLDAMRSRRPTSAPDFDLGALALACLDNRSFAMPMGLFVPLRTSATRSSASGLDLREAFLLLHVDGRSTVAQIAQIAQLPGEEVASGFLRLVALGVVEMTTSAECAAPVSGVHPCDAADPHE